MPDGRTLSAMTLLMAEGFDLIATTDLQTKWSSAQITPGGNGGNITTGGRVSGNKLHCSADVTFNGSTFPGALGHFHAPRQTIIAGFACQFFGGAATHNHLFWIFDTLGGTQGLVAWNPNTGFIDVYRGLSTLLFSTTVPITQNRFYYVEVKWILHPSNGTIILRQDGVQVGSITGVSTQQTATNNIGQTWFGMWGGISIGNSNSHLNYRVDFDDIYICDSLGTTNNDFLGDLRVYGILPDTSGTYTQFTKVGAAATNWQSVNENPNNGDTTYVTNNLVGTMDTYMFPNLPADAADVLAVIGEPVSRKDDVGYRAVGTHIRMPGGSEGDSPTATAVNVIYTIAENIMENNPATAAPWSVTDVNTMEAGPRIAV